MQAENTHRTVPSVSEIKALCWQAHGLTVTGAPTVTGEIRVRLHLAG